MSKDPVRSKMTKLFKLPKTTSLAKNILQKYQRFILQLLRKKSNQWKFSPLSLEFLFPRGWKSEFKMIEGNQPAISNLALYPVFKDATQNLLAVKIFLRFGERGKRLIDLPTPVKKARESITATKTNFFPTSHPIASNIPALRNLSIQSLLNTEDRHMKSDVNLKGHKIFERSDKDNLEDNFESHPPGSIENLRFSNSGLTYNLSVGNWDTVEQTLVHSKLLPEKDLMQKVGTTSAFSGDEELIKLSKPVGIAELPSANFSLPREEVNRVAEEVYTIIEKKLRTECESKGIFV